MRAARLAPLLAAAALSAGCQDDGAPPVSFTCSGEPETIVRALATAPGTVKLEDGTTLSACLRDADTDADLQNVGSALTSAAEDLEDRALGGDARAALQLGYLVGAARKGAKRTSGVGAELVHRLERSAAALDGATSDRAAALLQRGLAAGEARG